MQTFLPYNSFYRTFQCLDMRRLNKQRSEAMILLNGGWPNHPASKMWALYKPALTEYMNCCIQEWIKRGYKNTMKIVPIDEPIIYPHWLTDERLLRSHRSNLLRKNPAYYGQFGWADPPDLPYFWPSGA